MKNEKRKAENKITTGCFRQRRSGFTMIELLIVVVVLGILTVLGLSSFAGSQKKARDGQRKTGLRELKTSLELYHNVYDAYPANDGANRIIGCGDPVSSCEWGEQWERSGNVFMKSLPYDPLAGQEYLYTQAGGNSYYIIATLERDSDDDIAESQAKCGRGTGSQYVVCED